MEKKIESEFFEHLLWQNELEYNRRELAIFESFLINRVAKIPSHKYQEFMSQVHGMLRTINKILKELDFGNLPVDEKLLTLGQPDKPGRVPEGTISERCTRYLREEMFYYEQNYRLFRKRFCNFVGELEYPSAPPGHNIKNNVTK